MMQARGMMNFAQRQRPSWIRQARLALASVFGLLLLLLCLVWLSSLIALAEPLGNRTSPQRGTRRPGRAANPVQPDPATARVPHAQAQIIRNVLPIQCSGQPYNVGFVMVSARLADSRPVKALGLILSATKTEGPTDAFCLYWSDKQANVPTQQDGLSTTPDGALVDYGSDNGGSGRETVARFFNKYGCQPPDESLVSAFMGAKQIQSLRDLLLVILGRDDDSNVIEAKPRELEVFAKLQDMGRFASGVHNYIKEVVTRLRAQDATKEGLELSVQNLTKERDEWKQKAGNVEWGLTEYGALTVAFLIGLVLGGGGLYYYLERWAKKPASYQSSSVAGQPISIQDALSAEDRQGLQAAKAELSKIIEKFQTRFTEEFNSKQKQPPHSIKHNPQPMYRLWLDLLHALAVFRDKALTPTWVIPEKGPEAQQPESSTNEISMPRAKVNNGFKEDDQSIRQINETSVPRADVDNSYASALAVLETRLQQFSEATRFLSTLWDLRYQRAYRDEQTADLADELRKACALCQELYAGLTGSRPPEGTLQIDQTRQLLGDVLADIDWINREHCSGRLGQAASLRNFVTVVKEREVLMFYLQLKNLVESVNETMFGYCDLERESLSVALQRIVREHSETLRLLREKNSDKRVNLLAVVQHELNQRQETAEKVRTLEVNLKDTKDQLGNAQFELMTSESLAATLGEQLHFKLDAQGKEGKTVSSALMLLQKEQKEDSYSQLRLGLSAALLALDKASKQGSQHGQHNVVEALNVEQLNNGVRDLLETMQDYRGRGLWEQGLFRSFAQGWLHSLLRAELLLRNYFADQPEFSSLYEAVTLAAASVRATLREYGIKLGEIELFEPLPSGVETDSVYPALRSLTAVGEKIRQRLATDSRPFVIDVVAFPFRDYSDPVKTSPGRAVIVNPSAWDKG